MESLTDKNWVSTQALQHSELIAARYGPKLKDNKLTRLANKKMYSSSFFSSLLQLVPQKRKVIK